MTKEEQWKKEAEVKLDELDDRGFDFDNWSISDTYERGYCDSAEPREKRIAELKRFIKDLFYENSNLCFHFNNTTCLFNADYRNRAEELIGERL